MPADGGVSNLADLSCLMSPTDAIITYHLCLSVPRYVYHITNATTGTQIQIPASKYVYLYIYPIPDGHAQGHTYTQGHTYGMTYGAVTVQCELYAIPRYINPQRACVRVVCIMMWAFVSAVLRLLRLLYRHG